MWKIRNFTLTKFWQKFREINFFTINKQYNFSSRNIFQVRVNFSIFHTVEKEWIDRTFSSAAKKPRISSMSDCLDDSVEVSKIPMVSAVLIKLLTRWAFNAFCKISQKSGIIYLVKVLFYHKRIRIIKVFSQLYPFRAYYKYKHFFSPQTHYYYKYIPYTSLRCNLSYVRSCYLTLLAETK